CTSVTNTRTVTRPDVTTSIRGAEPGAISGPATTTLSDRTWVQARFADQSPARTCIEITKPRNHLTGLPRFGASNVPAGTRGYRPFGSMTATSPGSTFTTRSTDVCFCPATSRTTR